MTKKWVTVPDAGFGWAVIIICTTLLAAIIFGPLNKMHGGPRVFVMLWAGMGINWGIGQIQREKKWKERLAKEADSKATSH
jgi:hypothetical protein